MRPTMFSGAIKFYSAVETIGRISVRRREFYP